MKIASIQSIESWRLRRMIRHQVLNLFKLFLGRPLTLPSLGSMTLEQDDVDITSQWLSDRSQWNNRKVVTDYESAFAEWNGSRHAFAFMGGRVALSACIHALGLQSGDEAILPGYTCVVVPNAFHYAGVNTVYSDIELDTYGLDVAQLEEKITPRTRVILLPHLYGLVCRDYEAIIALARLHNLKVIEDCAHSTGAKWCGSKVGNLGDVAFYSSEQSKVLNTIQGGMAVTNDDTLAIKLKEYYEQAAYPSTERIEQQLHNVYLNYFQQKHPSRWWRGDLAELLYGDKLLISTTQEEEKGRKPSDYGNKMPAPIAAIGLNQLKKIDRFNQLRCETAKHWDLWCEKHGYAKPLVVEGSEPVFLRYPVLVEAERKKNRSWAVKELGVDIGIWFVSNIHPTNQCLLNFNNANIAVSRCINFPTLLQ